MSNLYEILQSEVERLFTFAELKTLISEYLDLGPEVLGGEEIGKAARAKRLIQFCTASGSIDALVDAIILMKGESADPRISHISTSYLPFGVPQKNVADVYEAGVILAEGGTGIVVSATKKDDKEDYVIKFVRPELAQYRRGVARYLTYMRSISRKRIKGIPEVVACGLLGNEVPYVVMKKADGASLPSLLEKGNLDFSTIARILLGVCGIIIELHSNGRVYGALKPSKVFVKMDGEEPIVSLLPSGNHLLLFRPCPGVEKSGMGVGSGTILYLSPDQVRGEIAGPSSDIYAFGLLSYEMMAGEPPFSGKNPAELFLAHLRKEAQPPSKRAPRASIPSRCDDLVFRCLEKDPSRRPASMGALRKELESIWTEDKAAKEMAQGVRAATVEELDSMAAEFLENPEVAELAEEVLMLAKGAKVWERGIEIMKQAIEKTSEKDVKKDLLFRLAGFLEKDIRDYDEAAGCYRQILEMYPDEEVAEAGVMDCLRNLRRYDDLVTVILDKLEKTPDERTRNALLKEVAAIYEKEDGEPSKALVVLLQIFQTNVSDREIIDSIGRLAEATGGWQDVFNTVNAVLNQPNLASDKAVAACNTAAKWYSEKLGRTDFALAFYERALSLSPSDESSLAGLARIYKSKGEYKELINILQRLVDTKPPGLERRELKMQIASTYQHNLGDAKQAETLYGEILQEDSLYDDAFTALEKILTKQERWKDLAKFTRQRAEIIEDRDRKVAALYALAEMVETRLADIPQAIAIHTKIVELKPDYILSLKALELLYSSVGDMKNLSAVLEREAAISATPKQKFDLAMRQGSIYEEEFIQNEKALEFVNAALEIDPKSLTALGAKARLMRKLERFEGLLDVLEKEIQQESDAEVKIDLLNEQSRILVEKFKRFSEATARMEKAFELAEGKKPGIIGDLVEICEMSGDTKGCVRWLEQLAETKSAKAEQAEIWVRIGDLQGEKLGETQRSLKSYQRALDFDSANVKAANALKAAFSDRGDHGAAIQMLQREIDATSGAIAKSRLYTEMGKIYRNDLRDTKKAIEHFEKAFDLDPTNAEAGEPLAELYRESNKWDDALKIFEHFSASVQAMKKEKGLELFLRFGEASLKKGDLEKARSAFAKAREMDPKDGYTLERFAHTVYALKDWKAATAAYSDYLLRFSDTIEKEDRFDIHMKLAMCHHETGELSRALEMLNKAIEIDAGHVEAFRLRAAIYEKRERWEETVDDMRKVMEFVDEEERFRLLIEAGQMLQEKIRDNEKASKSYQSALEIKPDDRATLLKLVQLYMAMEKWQKVVEVVLKLADLVEDKKELATYYKTAAQLCDQYLGRKDDALSYYELAIENDPSQLDLLDAIGNIMTERNEWHGLERTYKKMLDKLPEGVEKEIKANLWHKLAELYLHRLERIPDAVNALETALKLDPSRRDWMEALADLYGDDMRYSDKAIALNREILQLNPYRIESYKTICRVYRKKGKYDQAWCAASTMSSLNVEDEDLIELYDAYRSEEPAEALERVNEDLWQRYLIHPAVDDKITGIFRILEGAILKAKAQSYASANLKPEQKIDPSESQELLPKTFHYAAGALGIPLPEFYVWREDKSIGIIFTPTHPPAIVVGGEALKAENTQTLAFVAARHLTYYLPGFYLRVFLQTGTSLSTWLLSAIKFIITQFPIPPDFKSRVPDAVGILKKHLDASQKDLLTAKIHTFMESVTGGIDLKKWATGVDFTADRAGMLLCNDMNVSMSIVRKLQVDSWFAPVKDRVAEMSLFSVSDEFFVLRQKLGIAIQTE